MLQIKALTYIRLFSILVSIFPVYLTDLSPRFSINWASASRPIAGHRHRDRSHCQRHCDIRYLSPPSLEHSGTGPGPLIFQYSRSSGTGIFFFPVPESPDARKFGIPALKDNGTKVKETVKAMNTYI
jgi:hypothetical protein